MNRTLRSPLLALALVATAGVVTTTTPSAASAAELHYRWKAGTSTRFQVTSDQAIAMAAGPMGRVETTFHTDTVFAVHVDRVAPDGTAHGVLAIERFDVTGPDGRRMAGLDKLPPKALTSLVEIDTKGRFQFKEIVYLMVTERQERFLVSASGGPFHASGTARAGDEEVHVWAEFDPKTGRVSGGASHRKLKRRKPAKRQIAAMRDAQRVDVVPFELLSLLRLPDGDLQQGARATMKVAGYEIGIEVSKLGPKQAVLKTAVRTTGGGAAAPAPGPGEAPMPGMPPMPESPEDPDMPEMPQMPDMGPGMGAPVPVGSPSSMMKLHGDFVQTFDVARGMLSGLKGTLKTTVSMPMGGLETSGTFKLRRL